MLSQKRAQVYDLFMRRLSVRSRERLIGRQRNGGERAASSTALAVCKRSVFVGLFVVGGCATAYLPPPLTTAHPAHPEAAAASHPPASNTLAYTPADMPSPRPTVARAEQGASQAFISDQQRSQTVVGEGKVIAVVPESSEIVLSHGEIQGFMEAMTMGYQIAPPALLEGVQAGDTVRFTIDTAQKAIVKIDKLK